MKAVLILAFIGLWHLSGAQSDLSKDPSIQNFIDEVEEHWEVSVKGQIIRIQMPDSIYMAHGNWINASTDHLESKNDSTWVTQDGRAYVAFIEYKIHDLQNSAQLKNGDFYSDQHILRYVRTSAGYDQFHKEWQYWGIWPKEAESFPYDLKKILEKHLKLVAE